MSIKRALAICVIVLIFMLAVAVIGRIFLQDENEPSAGKKSNPYPVQYVPKAAIYPAYGLNRNGQVTVREDLPPRVRQFVTAHELYHLQDKATWGGQAGRDLRANIVPGLDDPLGFAATAWSAITDTDRINFLVHRFQNTL